MALWLPHALVASQLRVISLVQAVPVVTSPRTCTVVPSHSSEAVGAVNDGVVEQLIVALAPGIPITGVGQLTVTFLEQTDGAISVLSNVIVRVTV